MQYQFEVAISFAGENREFAESIADGLKQNGVKVFYDNFYAADLWGEDLSVRLREIYHEQSRYCIMILTQPYVEKMWTNFERQQAIERLIEEKGNGYVLPVRLDGFAGEVPGLSKNIGYLSVTSDNPELAVNRFLEKIGQKISGAVKPEQPKKSGSFISKLKKSFTDKEKNQFIKKSFEDIVGSIDGFVSETKRNNPSFEHEIEKLTSRNVLFTLYDAGKELTRFRIWLGGMMGDESIYFVHGSSFDAGGGSSYNESLSLEEHEGELKLKALGMGNFGGDGDRLMSPREAAEYLWQMACQHL